MIRAFLRGFSISLCALIVGCDSSSSTSTPESISIDVIYQPFEYGFMVQRVDEECVYAFSNLADSIIVPRELDNVYHYCLEFAGLPQNEAVVEHPAGDLLLPDGAFGRVWSHYNIVRQNLGFATAHSESFAGSIPSSTPILNGAPISVPVAPLPDGKVLWCGMRAATAGTCSIR